MSITATAAIIANPACHFLWRKTGALDPAAVVSRCAFFCRTYAKAAINVASIWSEIPIASR